VRLLRRAGLIELVGTEEVRGGALKYYASRRRVYAVEAPNELGEQLEPLAEELYKRLKPLILEAVDEYRGLILELAKRLKPCPYRVTAHFAEYILVEAFRRALGKTLHDPEVEEKLSTFRSAGEEQQY